ncbi:PaaI family thioesterase [Pseudomonas stutzeri]|uniref:PaaI family thioesterase n=1 Tax=Stutzerimonas stutzeri TaxID=316 RepID=UPI00210D5C6F|nr:PaaI family thioesterase [Stutzerimonas stutzeri]MCQ4308543.1 PaaI family thioesterase [Stutzerimonas stutzeri]
MSIQVEAVGNSSAFGRLLGLEIHKVENGEAQLGLTVHDGLRNLHGKLHGGALFSLIDTAMGQASHSLNGGLPNSVTLECKVNYIRPVTEGELTCRAWVVHAGRRTQVLEAEVHQGEKLIAKAQSTFACL